MQNTEARSRSERLDPALWLEPLPIPLWILGSDAAIEFANAAARETAQFGASLLGAAGRLLKVGTADIRQLLALPVPRTAQRIYMSRLPGGTAGYAIMGLSMVETGSAYADHWPSARAMLTVAQDMPPSIAERVRQLARESGLTASETQVLLRLAEGLAVAEIAAERGVSPCTIRCHLRALFDKTGCRRQAELVRLALSG